MSVRVARTVAWVAFTLCTTSCSGSGDGAGPPAGGSDAFTISPTSLRFDVRGGEARPPPQTVTVTATSAPVFVKTNVSGAAVESATVQVTGTTTAIVAVQAASPAMLPNGTSTAQVSIIGCKDPVCSSEVAGSPKTVEVTYTKATGGITGMPNAMTFAQTFGAAAPAAQPVSLKDLGGASFLWTSSIAYQNGSGWLSVTPASGTGLPATATVSVSPLSAPGTYNATLQFAEGTASQFAVAVTYTLSTVSSAFQVTPTSLDVVGTFGAATPGQTLSLSDGQGKSYGWTVSVEYTVNDLSGWATPAQTSGASLPVTLTVAFGALPDRLTHEATLHITGGGTEVLVPVSYRTP
jgi:hypothetical protein